MTARRLNISLWLLFVLLFIYLVLRAWLVEPLKDELLTYYFFVERGSIIDDVVIGDEANNHLLNSFLAHFLNRFDNGNFFLLRLPNLLAFPLFFFGIVKLARSAGKEWQQLLLVAAAVCVPFYFEYFAACRGYGLALTAMVWMLWFLRSFIASPSARTLALACLAAWIMVFANLGYLVLAVTALGITAVFQLAAYKKFPPRRHLVFAAIQLLFLVALLPFVRLAGELREAGALYYGSMDGFWLVTAKSVLRYTIFYEANWLKFLLGLCFLALLVFAARNILTKRLTGFFRLPETVYLLFLAGNVAAIFFLAKVKNVNYPEDRVAMHLALLTILLTGTLLARSRYPGSMAVLAVFPVIFCAKMNLDSSVISPDDRMNEALYRKAATGLNAFSTVGGYHTLPLMWTWNQRKSKGSHIEMQVPDGFYPYFDYLFTRAGLPEKNDSITGYTLVGSHERSLFRLWKRDKPAKRKFAFGQKSAFGPSDGEYFNFAAVQITGAMRQHTWLAQVSAHLRMNGNYGDVFLAYGTIKEDGSQGRYEQFNLPYSHGYGKKVIPLAQNFIFPPFTADEKELRIYIWNRERANMYFYDGLVKFYELQP